MKKRFNKNLIMIEKEEEEQFLSSNTCQICEKLTDNDNKKVRDHCHITGKFRGAGHQGCNGCKSSCNILQFKRVF